MTSPTKQIPCLRVFVEGVVIVVSILLAFGGDAWWGKPLVTHCGRSQLVEKNSILQHLSFSKNLLGVF